MIGDNKAGTAWDTGMPPEEATKVVKRAREINPETQPDSAIPHELFTPGEEVLLKEQQGAFRKMRPLFKEGYVVVKRVGPVNYVIRNESGQEKVYHRDKLKKAGTRWATPIFIQPQSVTQTPPAPDNGGRRYPSRERKPPDFYQG